jgi:hypothetical protein
MTRSMDFLRRCRKTSISSSDLSNEGTVLKRKQKGYQSERFRIKALVTGATGLTLFSPRSASISLQGTSWWGARRPPSYRLGCIRKMDSDGKDSYR